MPRTGSHSPWPLLAFSLWAAFPPGQAVLAAESAGVAVNYCSTGPFHFTFSALPDSCSFDMAGLRCPQSQPGDLTMSDWVLKAPGGVVDFGPLDDSGLAKEYDLPTAGYQDSALFQPRRLYAMKVSERGYALFSEVRGFIGGCLHQEFRWRYNDAGNRFTQVPVGLRRERKIRLESSGDESRAAGVAAAPTERRVSDARGRKLEPASGSGPQSARSRIRSYPAFPNQP